MTIQDFANTHDFFRNRRRAQGVANLRRTVVKHLGVLANGSYGVYSPLPNATTVRVYAVAKGQS